MATDINEDLLSLEEFVKLPTTVSFNVFNTDRFKLFVQQRPYLHIGTELASGYIVVYTHIDNLMRAFRELGNDFLNFFPYILSPLDSLSNDDAGITQVLNQPYLNLSGQGVIIGFVDTGIDYTQDVFRYEDGSSKILYIWDQSVDGPKTPDIYYGAVYNRETINRALQSDDPYSVVPSRDVQGHGTFLASVAAGNAEGQLIGAAPRAEIIAVKLRRASQYYIDKYLLPPDNPNLYESTDFLLGLKFLFDRAEELNMPVVACVGMGTNFSAHDGSTFFEDYVTFASQRVGYCFVTAAGNESNAKHHTMGTILRTGTRDTINIRVGVADTSFTVMIIGEAFDKLSVGLTTPSGEVITRLPFRVGMEYNESFIFEKTNVTIEYYKDTSTVIFLRFREATQGIWEITLFGDSIVSGDYHAWLPITGQVSEQVEFLRPVPEFTIVSPATGLKSLTCGAYNSENKTLFVSSSWGPTRLVRMLPDFVAPGVNVRGVFPTGPGNMTGTSVAAAVTAGAAALMFEWGIVQGNMPAMDGDLIRTLFISGSTREEGMSYPNVKWGFGRLDLFGTFSILKETGTEFTLLA